MQHRTETEDEIALEQLQQLRKIREEWTRCMADQDYETGGFMVPQLIKVTPADLDEWEIPEEDRDIWSGVPTAARLSAPGYLDCTEWYPIGSAADVRGFFEFMCFQG